MLTVFLYIMQWDCMYVFGWWLWTIPFKPIVIGRLMNGMLLFTRVVILLRWCNLFGACMPPSLSLSLYHSLMYPTFPLCIPFFKLCKCYVIESTLRSMVDPKEHDRAQQANGGDHQAKGADWRTWKLREVFQDSMHVSNVLFYDHLHPP